MPQAHENDSTTEPDAPQEALIPAPHPEVALVWAWASLDAMRDRLNEGIPRLTPAQSETARGNLADLMRAHGIPADGLAYEQHRNWDETTPPPDYPAAESAKVDSNGNAFRRLLQGIPREALGARIRVSFTANGYCGPEEVREVEVEEGFELSAVLGARCTLNRYPVEIPIGCTLKKEMGSRTFSILAADGEVVREIPEQPRILLEVNNG